MFDKPIKSLYLQNLTEWDNDALAKLRSLFGIRENAKVAVRVMHVYLQERENYLNEVSKFRSEIDALNERYSTLVRQNKRDASSQGLSKGKRNH